MITRLKTTPRQVENHPKMVVTMDQNINKMLGSMPDDIEKGGKLEQTKN